MVKYSCERCGKEFSQKSYYDSHNRRITVCIYIYIYFIYTYK